MICLLTTDYVVWFTLLAFLSSPVHRLLSQHRRLRPRSVKSKENGECIACKACSLWLSRPTLAPSEGFCRGARASQHKQQLSSLEADAPRKHDDRGLGSRWFSLVAIRGIVALRMEPLPIVAEGREHALTCC